MRVLSAIVLILSAVSPRLAAGTPKNYYAFWGGNYDAREVTFFPGQGLMSLKCGYRVVMRWDGQFVIEARDGDGGAWYGNGTGYVNGSGYASIGNDGVLRYFNWADRTVWSSSSPPSNIETGGIAVTDRGRL